MQVVNPAAPARGREETRGEDVHFPGCFMEVRRTSPASFDRLLRNLDGSGGGESFRKLRDGVRRLRIRTGVSKVRRALSSQFFAPKGLARPAPEVRLHRLDHAAVGERRANSPSVVMWIFIVGIDLVVDALGQ